MQYVLNWTTANPIYETHETTDFSKKIKEEKFVQFLLHSSIYLQYTMYLILIESILGT